jgi:hypothetical protein
MVLHIEAWSSTRCRVGACAVSALAKRI